MNWWKFLIQKVGVMAGMLLALTLISHWIISNIPGSYQDIISQENENLAPDSLRVTAQAIPIFYWSLVPEFTEEEKNNSSSIPITRLLPDWRWNGCVNSFHKSLTQTSYSLRDGQAVSKKIWQAIQWTLIIQLPALLLIFTLGIFLAEWSVRSNRTILVKWLNSILTAFHSIPVFWLASLLLVFFSGQGFLHVFPSSFVSANEENPLAFWSSKIVYIILPLISIVLPALAVIYHIARRNFLDQMNRPFWKRILSTGVGSADAIRQELRPLVMIPLSAWIASAIPFLISGSIIIENIFSVPGTGRLLFQSISYRDWPVVHGIFILAAFLSILGIMLAEIIQKLIDRR